MLIGNREFETKGHTYVMGILNVTPDSFSDGGKFSLMDEAVRHAQKMCEEGADIIDVGGESTRPGYTQISVEEEIERVAPVIERIKQELNIPVSIDTYKPEVAEAAISAGASLVNDIWGLTKPGMAELVAKQNIPCCLMHNRATGTDYGPDMKATMEQEMKQAIDHALKAGVDKDKIILDPGIGFAKTTDQNLSILRDPGFMLPEGYPILLGASRKSFIGDTLNVPVEDRLEGTLVTTVLAAERGCMFVRVHDVLANVRCIKMLEAIQK